jgi:UDP-glucose 4-epimerase
VELIAAGYDVVAIDNFSNSQPEAMRRVFEITNQTFPVYKVELNDRLALSRVFTDHSIDAVIHFAGLKAVGESVSMPLWYYHNNIAGTILLCEVMRMHGVRNLVFSSSATVYGIPEKLPITENAPLTATNPYGRTKLMIEQILEDLWVSDPAWSISILRYFNPIGAHSSGRIGEDPNGVPNNLMPYIAQVAVGKLERLSIYGHDYPTVDGTGVRDYIHVVDLAQGHIRALDKLMRSTGVSVYNLGTGKGYSVLEMVEAFAKVSGKAIPYRLTERRPGDVAACYADPSKARHELGWFAQRGIEEMCEDAWRWQFNNPQGYAEAKEVYSQIS